MKLLICNLKMNHQLKEMLEYKKVIEESKVESNFLLCPATCYLPVMHSKYYKLCAQDISKEQNQNNTGEISAEALKSLDVNATLIGHYETHDILDDKVEKVKNAVKNKIHAYVILSETKEENDYQYTSFTLLGQIRKILEDIKKDQYDLITFIYEPSWLIGSNETMDPKVVSRIFFHIKEDLKKEFNKDFQFLYGGGLTKRTILPFLNYETIDGLLLGNYSLNATNVINLLKNEKFRQN